MLYGGFFLFLVLLIIFLKLFLPLTGPGLALKDEIIPNHSVLKRDPSVIGTDNDALYCLTDDLTCCETPPCNKSHCSCNCRGHWYAPNNRQVNSCNDTNNPYCESCLTDAVLLNYHGDGGKTGLFRCDIKDSKNNIHHLYTCIYGDGPSDFNCKVHSSVLHSPIHYCLLKS